MYCCEYTWVISGHHDFMARDGKFRSVYRLCDNIRYIYIYVVSTRSHCCVAISEIMIAVILSIPRLLSFVWNCVTWDENSRSLSINCVNGLSVVS